MADNLAKIIELRAKLQAGTTAITTDGFSKTVDLNQVRKELNQLISEDDTLGGQRPRVSTIDLSDCI